MPDLKSKLLSDLSIQLTDLEKGVFMSPPATFEKFHELVGEYRAIRDVFKLIQTYTGQEDDQDF